jgi:anaerobic selenocysteine-containing dehydrogenase
VAFYNAMMHVILEENLIDEAYVRDHTSGYLELKRTWSATRPR